MNLPKNFIHDRIVLLILSINAFLVLAGTALVLLRLDGARSSGYIAEYRSNLGITAFKPGNLTDVLAFILFFVVVLGLHTVLSVRMFGRHRQYALAILGMATLLLILGIIVSNALLVLR